MDLSKLWEQHLDTVLTPIPTEPFAAAELLAVCIELLQQNLPSWVRFPEDHNLWTPQQKLQRCWPREFWALVSAGTSEGAYMVSYVPGRSDLGEHILRTLRPNTRETPPPEMPDRIRESLEAGWQQRRPYGAPRDFIYVRNEWSERCTLVAPFKERIHPLLDLAHEAVQRKGADPAAILSLREDLYLHTDTLAEALKCLPLVQPGASAAPPAGTAMRLTLDPTSQRGGPFDDFLRKEQEEQKRSEAMHLMVAQANASADLLNDLRDLARNSRRERDSDATGGERRTRSQGSGGSESLGEGGPAKVLDAVYRAIQQATGKRVVEGAEEVPRTAVMQCLDGQDAKKAADYLAPSGRLCVGGWIERDGATVILTPKGAVEAMQRRQREERRRQA